MRLIFYDRFWFVHILLVIMVKFLSHKIIITIIILVIWEFFTPALVNGFLLESVRLQVSSSLQDSS